MQLSFDSQIVSYPGYAEFLNFSARTVSLAFKPFSVLWAWVPGNWLLYNWLVNFKVETPSLELPTTFALFFRLPASIPTSVLTFLSVSQTPFLIYHCSISYPLFPYIDFFLHAVECLHATYIETCFCVLFSFKSHQPQLPWLVFRDDSSCSPTSVGPDVPHPWHAATLIRTCSYDKVKAKQLPLLPDI